MKKSVLKLIAPAFAIMVLAHATTSLGSEPQSHKTIDISSRDKASHPILLRQGLNPNDQIRLLDSPGLGIGRTYFDMQTNGSAGNRIAVDALGGIHYCWIGAATPSLDTRGIWYGYRAANSDSLPGFQISNNALSGFGTIGILNGASIPGLANSAVLGFHSASANLVRLAIDSSMAEGRFEFDMNGFPSGAGECIWPTISVDINDNIHAVATQSNSEDGMLRYNVYSHRSSISGSAWSDPTIFDSTFTISANVTSSKISGKSAVVWTSPIHQDDNQFDNDVVFVESADGQTWDFIDGKMNVTNYSATAIGDTTFRAYTDLDAVYDANDNLHIIWNAPRVTRDAQDNLEVLYQTGLYHWSQATGITPIYLDSTTEWVCDMGAWNLPISKMSIGVDADSNFLYTVFTKYEPTDYSHFGLGETNPCGGDNAMPCCNGELYMCYSRDGGLTWSTPVNITNSATPDCTAGNCDNDNWSSLAEVVDNYLHIIYIDDKDAGSAVLGEGDITSNPVIYLKYSNPTRTLGGCEYVVGDINNSGTTNGLDVTYGVNFFKGGAVPPYSCQCAEHGEFYVAGDVNASCSFNGIDITYLVNYFKGGAALIACPDCPPIQ